MKHTTWILSVLCSALAVALILIIFLPDSPDKSVTPPVATTSVVATKSPEVKSEPIGICYDSIDPWAAGVEWFNTDDKLIVWIGAPSISKKGVMSCARGKYLELSKGE